MKSIIFAVFLLSISLPATYSRHVQFYRKDYTYIEAFDAFYKVHWDMSGRTWKAAFSTCDDEGATLFYPKVHEEWTLVKNLTNKMTEPPNVTDIFVGFHDDFQLGEFMTVDGQSTPYPLPDEDSSQLSHDNCITMNIDTGSFSVSRCVRAPNEIPVPFVCKKVDDESCPTIDRDYKYVKISRKCYKVNKKLQNWQKAMKTCFMEGGILAVVENSAQAQVIKDMIDGGESYFVGIKKLFSRNDYYSVKGQKFSNLYQRRYDSNDYECGTVRSENSYLFTDGTNCDNILPFICEMEIGIYTERQKERGDEVPKSYLQDAKSQFAIKEKMATKQSRKT